MSIAERNRKLSEAAAQVEQATLGFFGSVQFNVQDGKVRNMEIRESVKVEPLHGSRGLTPFGSPPEE